MASVLYNEDILSPTSMETFTKSVYKCGLGYRGGVVAKVDGQVVWSEYTPYAAADKATAMADATMIYNNHMNISNL